MESLLFVGFVVLLFLVIGARRRLGSLESELWNLRTELQSLQEKNFHINAAEKSSRQPQTSVETPETESCDEMEFAEAVLPKTSIHSPVIEEYPLDQAIEEAITAKVIEFETAPITDTNEQSEVPTGYVESYEPSDPPGWMLKAKEWLFGGNLVAKVGLLILFIGVGFLLKFAATRFSFPIEFRLAAVALVDMGLLFWGWRIRESRSAIGLPVQGGAIAILMLVVFFAFRRYELIPGELAFGLLFFLTLFTCILAISQNAIWLAVFGIAGGFAAPIMASTGDGSHIALFSYYALLNAGILFIALKRSWRLLNLLGFWFTFIIGTTWGVQSYEPEHYFSAQAFLILFFIFYVFIAILFAHRESIRLRHYVDGTLVFGTPLTAFGLQYGLIRDEPFGLAFSALALGLFYTIIARLLWRRDASLKLLVESFFALGIVFGTLAIPLALDGRWTSAAWALEGAGLVWVGLRQRRMLTWIFGVLVQVGAWVSFICSLFWLNTEQAMLWLGFLLLAVAAFSMALNFHHEAKKWTRIVEESDKTLPPIAGYRLPSLFTTLSTLFLGFASIWLLTAAWVEIFLHTGIRMPTLLVLSALGVAAILFWLASRFDWPISRYFALAPQLLAGLSFLAIFASTRLSSMIVSDNLLDTNFFGALFMVAGAISSGLNFHRQETKHRLHLAISRSLLGWGGFWWLAGALVIISAWGENLLTQHAAFADLASSPLRPLYYLLLAGSVPLTVRLSRRLGWPDMNWMATAVWPYLLFAMVALFLSLFGSDHRLPHWFEILAVVALWLASEWLMREGENEGWMTLERFPRLLHGLHTLRIAGPWLILGSLGHNLLEHWLDIGTLARNATYSDEWFVAGSWSLYLPAWAMMAYIALLIPRACANLWPTRPIAQWYRDVLIPLGAVCALILAVCWNFTQNGRMEPLPYLPILNPLDLTTGFAALLSVAAWRLREQPVDQQWMLRLQTLACGGAYLWFNLMLLRTAAHFLDIPYQVSSLFESQFIQAMLSLVWCASALVLMRVAAGRLQRRPWIAGAALLTLVVVKLFFVDRANVGGIERIVSFLGVGILMLAIAYLAPYPSEKNKHSG